MASFNTLRAISNRLNNTPIHELPQQVGFLATSLASCKYVLQSLSAGGNDNTVLLHKLKTRISALLQDRSCEGRMSGIVMVKALVEAGGVSLLSESASWVRNLITCLNKSDPWEVKRLGVMTIARIYILTVPHQALIREITTPTLPAFISASLTAIKPATTTIQGKTIRALSPLVDTVLTAWHALIEHFASTFRPHLTSLRAISLSLLSDQRCPSSVALAANRLLARLHFCAPRNTSASEWSQTCAQVIEAAHDTADLVFRAIIEDWKPSVSRVSKALQKQKSPDTPVTKTIDSIGLDPWSGLSEGASRLIVHINLLQHFLVSEHAQAMQIPFSNIFDLTARLCSVTIPTQKFSLRVNNEITRDEREELWMNTPRIHVAVLELFKALLETYDQTLLSIADAMITQLWDIFKAEANVDVIRAATYNLTSSLLSRKLFHVDKSDSANVSLLINHCCDDLKIQSGLTNASNSLDSNKVSTAELTLLTTTKKDNNSLITAPNPSLYKAAHNLLPLILTHLPFHLTPGSNSFRTALDSTAILIQHHEAILASTLNPPQSRSKTGRKLPAPSLLPFLARSESNSLLTNLAKEALLRPRMPVIRSTVANDDDPEEPDLDQTEDTNMNNTQAQQTSVVNTLPEIQQHPLELADNNQTTPTTESPKGKTNANPSRDQNGATINSQPQPNMSFSSTAQKRDFTALLEQSANAQLAAEGVSPSRFGEATEELEVEKFIPKKARIAETMIENTQAAESTRPHNNIGNKVTTDMTDVDMRTQEETEIPLVISVDETRLYDDDMPDSNILVANKTNDMSKGKEKAVMEDDYEATDSSDSEIPPIDATLAVGFSEDSEDEEVMENRGE